MLLLIGVLAGSAKAVPLLQLYVEGATYDQETETWIADFSGTGKVRLWAIGNVAGEGGKGTIHDVKLAIAYSTGAVTPSFSFVSSTTNGYGGFSDSSEPLPIVAPSQIGTDGSIPKLSDGRDLPSHGEYGPGTSWQEFLLGDFSMTDSPTGDFTGAFPTTFSASGSQINVYEITISGTTQVHFDLYDNVQSKNKARAVFAPFSHDAGSGATVPDGGSTIALLSLAMVGIGGFQWKRKRL